MKNVAKRKITSHQNGDIEIRLSQNEAKDLVYSLWQAVIALDAKGRVDSPPDWWQKEIDHKEWFNQISIRADDMATDILRALDRFVS